MDTGILLESGTNELEILEFCIENNYYGINVAKTKEIIPYKKPIPIPNTNPCIEGVFMPRDEIITVINLGKYLHIEQQPNESDMYVITNFNKLNAGFHVNRVVGITRVSWADIIKPDATLNGEDGTGVATGIVKMHDRLVVILDFEKIVSDINPETGLKVSDVEHLENRNKCATPILVTEDSALLSRLICDSLEKAGYSHVQTAMNGKEAWDKLNDYQKAGTLKENVQLVITDIEMPQMDGHRLTKLIKDTNEFKDIPVIIFSSLINEEMRRKGEALGADAQLSKPEIGALVEVLDKILRK